jgi:hypothetical protein
MISGNGVPAASHRDQGNRVRDDRPLRDIQDLIAKLEDLNRQLSTPVRTIRDVPVARTPVPADAPGANRPPTPATD